MMRTNIVIDDQLMADAMRASGAKTKKEAVEEALRLVREQGGAQRVTPPPFPRPSRRPGGR